MHRIEKVLVLLEQVLFDGKNGCCEDADNGKSFVCMIEQSRKLVLLAVKYTTLL